MSDARVYKKDLERQITRAHRDVLDGLLEFEFNTGEVYPTYRGMARMFEVANSTVALAIKAFVKQGWVVIHKWTDEQGQERNRYEFAGELASYVSGIVERKKKAVAEYAVRLSSAIEAGIRRQMAENVRTFQRNAMKAAKACVFGRKGGAPMYGANLSSDQLTYKISRTRASIEAFEGKKIEPPAPGKTKTLLALERLAMKTEGRR